MSVFDRMNEAAEPVTEACHPEGYKCLGDPLAEALGDSMVATDDNYSWRDLDPGYHRDLLYRANRVRKSLANRGLAVAAERATAAVDRCDKIVNNGMGEPTECGRTLPCEYHPAGAVDVEREAREVMRLLDQHGPSIVPHLLDTDDNPGERLRQALARLSGESER